MSFQQPGKFDFPKPSEWTKWLKRFERYSIVSGLDKKENEMQTNVVLYCMGDEAEDILTSFGLSVADKKDYAKVKTKFDDHFVGKRNLNL